MNKEYLKKLAALTLKGGVNAQPGQVVYINTSVDGLELAREIARQAYEMKVSEVEVAISDPYIEKQRYLYADDGVFSSDPGWKAARLNETAAKGACYIRIVSSSPDAMKGVDSSRILRERMALNQAAGLYREALDTAKNAWTVVAVPSAAWAQKVFPGLDSEQAVEALWADIFEISRVDDKDPLENWKQHDESFQKRVSILNSLNLKSLHYKNQAGTDLIVGLPEGYLFAGGGTTLANGLRTYPNIPTEEIFAAPHKYSVNGTLVSTMPLSLDGSLVEGMKFVFENGKVKEFSAETNQELMEARLAADPGASYLGEVALVPWGSAISQKGRIYYTTLFDENASCHFAVGSAYPENIQGGLEMNKEQLENCGLNTSAIHIDFMVGSEDLEITGITHDNQEVRIFENGKFAPSFDRIPDNRVQ